MKGGCHCRAVRYEVEGEVLRHNICHCQDCRRSTGAPLVAWMMLKAEQVRVTSGIPKVRASSEHGGRQFCGDCGTGLFYTNEAILPGLIDVQSATLDDPGQHAPEVHFQVAERLSWIEHMDRLPAFDRYPG